MDNIFALVASGTINLKVDTFVIFPVTMKWNIGSLYGLTGQST